MHSCMRGCPGLAGASHITWRQKVQCTVLNRQSHYAAQVSFDLLDNYPGGPYKSRGGSIKRTRFVEEEEDEDDEDDAVRIRITLESMQHASAGSRASFSNPSAAGQLGPGRGDY